MGYSLKHLPVVGLLAATTVSAGVVSVPFAKRYPVDDTVPSLIRRDGTVDLRALNNITGGGYYAEFGIGTPPQNLSFMLDTGSSDTWVNSVDADLCSDELEQEQNGYCQKQFDPEGSSTFKVVARNGFDISYLDGREIQGDYFNDSVVIDGAVIKNQQLGLALESVRPTGIMGLGLTITVAAKKKYPTIVDNLVSQGIINAPVFSLYLNDLQSKEGTVLFGGVDTEKIIDDLAVLPMQSVPGSNTQEITSYAVKLTGLSVTGVKTDSLSAVTILDSGSTLSLLPDAFTKKVWNQFGVKNVQGLPVAFVDCARANDKATFDFEFGSKSIKIPLEEFVIDSFADFQDELMSQPSLQSLFKGWKGVCAFGISSTADFRIKSDQFALLGDTFLRSAYVVYDLANKQIGMAQASLNSTSSKIVEFKKGDSISNIKGTGADTSPKDGKNSKDSAASAFGPSFSIAVAGTLLMTVAAVMNAF
ncbi:putative aspartic-type endopeptidase opsB [Cladobotryum mycophilum]|uniref:Aspartic-type endopeptidase opsB n=1 Tax=Cladobotryum mycophilum TaxID=491253 RepID=A0ABR0SFZ5_9HYPO